MTPQALLQLWRARWSKPEGLALRIPYSQGRMVVWMQRLAQSQFWSLPGVALVCGASALALLLLAPEVELSSNSQIVWGALLLAGAIQARRWEGLQFTLLLGGLSLVAALRYFYWRMDSTLYPYGGVDLALGLTLWAAEVYLFCMAAWAYARRVLGAVSEGPDDFWTRGQQGLRFYAPLVRGFLYLLPLLALLGSWPLVHTSVGLLLAYGVPHWVLGRFAQSGLRSPGRLTLLTFLREHLVSVAVLYRTVVSFATAIVLQTWRRRRGLKVIAPALADATQRFYALAVLIQSVLLMAVLWRDGTLLWQSEEGAYAVYALWAVYNVLRLVASMAVRQEAAMVQQVYAQCASLPATLRLPTGHLLACKTENFPSTLLTLNLPVPAPEPLPRESLHVSIFKGYREHVFPARLHSQDAMQVVVAIEGSSADAFQSLAREVFSRDANWPGWLAGPRADILLPRWVHHIAALAEGAFYNLVVRITTRSLWQRCRDWFQRGK